MYSGTIVKGFVYKVVINATGRFRRSSPESSAAVSICSGPGISPENRPIATPPETDLRFRCQRLG